MDLVSAVVIVVAVNFLALFVAEALVVKCNLQSPGLARHKRNGGNLAVCALIAEIWTVGADPNGEEPSDEVEIVPILRSRAPHRGGACEQRRARTPVWCRRAAVTAGITGAVSFTLFVLAVRMLAAGGSRHAIGLVATYANATTRT